MKATGLVLDVINRRGGPIPSTTTLYDRSRFKNNGTITGATWYQLPNGLWVQQHNAVTNMVTVPHSKSIALMSDLSISWWLKSNVTMQNDPGLTETILWSKGTSYALIYYRQYGGLLIFYPNAGANKYGYISHTFYADVWYQIILTWYNNLQSGFITVNGNRLAMQMDNPGTLVSNLDPFILSPTSNIPYDGSVWHFRMNNYALNATQTQSLFDSERRLLGA